MLTTFSTGSEQVRGNLSESDISVPVSSSKDSAGEKRALVSSTPAGEEEDQHEMQVASSLDSALMHLFRTH